MVQIIDLSDDEELIQQTAEMLMLGFRDTTPAWSTLEEALSEVRDSLAEDRISRIAVDADKQVLGWIGGIQEYDYGWELHPLVVHPAHQGKGIGRLLVEDLETLVRKRGGLMIYLGTDDETFRTSLSGVDLYPNPWEHIAKLENSRNHPVTFYQRMGYTIVGVIPDANGIGKPDILMAKRLVSI